MIASGIIVRGPGLDPQRCTPKTANLWTAERGPDFVRVLINVPEGPSIWIDVPALEAVKISAELASIAEKLLRAKLGRIS